MPRTAKYSRQQLCRKLLPVFKTFGYEGASIARLSSASGLSKASLYHHFPNGKEEMARHILALSGGQLQTLVLTPLAATASANATSHLDAIKQSFEGIAQYYDGQTPTCLMNSLLIGDGQALFSGEIDQAFQIWTEQLASALGRAGIDNGQDRAKRILEQIQGALVVCRVQQSREPLDALLVDCFAEIADLAK